MIIKYVGVYSSVILQLPEPEKFQCFLVDQEVVMRLNCHMIVVMVCVKVRRRLSYRIVELVSVGM